MLWIDQLRDQLEHHFRLRWVLANTLGWTIGLYAGILNPICFAGAGLIAGVILGVAQVWAFRSASILSLSDSESDVRRWVMLTFAGVALGMIPAALLGLLYIFGWHFGIILAGALLGGAVGAAQWVFLRRFTARLAWWIGANLLGGAICGLLTTIPLIPGVPLGLLAGSALFGYLTARALEKIIASPSQ